MNQADDRVFIRRFSGVILGLVGVTVAIIVLAVSLRSEPDPSANPSQQRFIEERIAPVAAVRSGSEGQAALAAATAEPAATATAAPVDGEQVYQSLCVSCHAAGVAEAPIPGSDAMAQRLAEKGLDELVSSAINGLNVMPPRGGNPQLTDDQIRAAVEFMVR